MSKAKNDFENSIKDAEDLLGHFDALPLPPPEEGEVLKRAGLIMALTAWETYVEDRVLEGVRSQLGAIEGSHAGSFMQNRLNEELKRFHNPAWDKVRKLFQDYLRVDVTLGWEWPNYDCARSKRTLNELLSKRGDAVHRSKPSTAGGPPSSHLINREDLAKAIRFLRSLVEATDQALDPH